MTNTEPAPVRKATTLNSLRRVEADIARAEEFLSQAVELEDGLYLETPDAVAERASELTDTAGQLLKALRHWAETLGGQQEP